MYQDVDKINELLIQKQYNAINFTFLPDIFPNFFYSRISNDNGNLDIKDIEVELVLANFIYSVHGKKIKDSSKNIIKNQLTDDTYVLLNALMVHPVEPNDWKYYIKRKYKSNGIVTFEIRNISFSKILDMIISIS